MSADSEKLELTQLVKLISKPSIVTLVSTNGSRLLEEHLGEFAGLIKLVPAGEPSSEALIELSDSLSKHPVSAIVAVGGGSVIDFAKLVAAKRAGSLNSELLANIDTGVVYLQDVDTIPIYAVPSILGSGAEVSSSAALEVRGRKVAIVSSRLKPAKVFVLPSFWPSDSSILIPGIIDTLSHSLEALLSKFLTPEVEILSMGALRSLATTHPLNLTDLNLTPCLYLASQMAGRAQDLASVSWPHALAHGDPSVPHGLQVGNYLVQIFRSHEVLNSQSVANLSEGLAGQGLSLDGIVSSIEQLLETYLATSDYSHTDLELGGTQWEWLASSPIIRTTKLQLGLDALRRLRLKKLVRT